MQIRILENLARLFLPRQKSLNGKAPEGAYHPGPYTVGGGWLPSAWGQYLNFWQMDLDPLPYPQCSIVEACVWAYISAIAQLPGFHRRELENGGTEDIHTSALSRVLRSPNTVAAPMRSLFQTDAVAIRMTLFVSWVMRRTGMVQTIASVTW